MASRKRKSGPPPLEDFEWVPGEGSAEEPAVTSAITKFAEGVAGALADAERKTEVTQATLYQVYLWSVGDESICMTHFFVNKDGRVGFAPGEPVDPNAIAGDIELIAMIAAKFDPIENDEEYREAVAARIGSVRMLRAQLSIHLEYNWGSKDGGGRLLRLKNGWRVGASSPDEPWAIAWHGTDSPHLHESLSE